MFVSPSGHVWRKIASASQDFFLYWKDLCFETWNINSMQVWNSLWRMLGNFKPISLWGEENYQGMISKHPPFKPLLFFYYYLKSFLQNAISGNILELRFLRKKEQQRVNSALCIVNDSVFTFLLFFIGSFYKTRSLIYMCGKMTLTMNIWFQLLLCCYRHFSTCVNNFFFFFISSHPFVFNFTLLYCIFFLFKS